jgi:hypothetical protein
MVTTERFDIYCDESCHLPHSQGTYMVLGALQCPHARTRSVAEAIREIKSSHRMAPDMEVKWTKVSPGKLPLYLDLVEYFFSEHHLTFRAVIADRSRLRHDVFDQTHDDWYYKMYFTLLRPILVPATRNRVFLDIKDTRGEHKVRKLHRVISNALRASGDEILDIVQQVRSHEVEQLQLADLLIGAVSAANQRQTRSPAKLAVIQEIQRRARLTLRHTTSLSSRKLNILQWEPRAAPRSPER